MPVDPKKITDELCHCGHLKSQHDDWCLPLTDYNRGCTICDCKRFTWKTFIDQDGNPVD